jgi:cell wall-associated NlpC family hydrolase
MRVPAPNSTKIKFGCLETLKNPLSLKHWENMRKLAGLAVLGSVMTFPAWTAQPLAVAYPPAILHAKAEMPVNTLALEHKATGELIASLPQQRGENLFNLPQEVAKTQSGVRFREVMQYAMGQNLSQRPMGEIIQTIAEQFVGTPYAAGLLDKSNQETLVLSLEGFDCVLFIETVLAMARGVALQDYSYQSFAGHIQNQRYRNGEMNGYCSRLHYFSDWIADNQKRGGVQNLTQSFGGIPLNNQLNFMSQHRSSYPQLANDDEAYECIVGMEANLAQLQVDYIPKNEIHTVYSRLLPGDVVAIATDVEGLDVTHTGLVYQHPDGSIGFIHASPSGEVKIARDLQAYVEAVESTVGVILARPVDSRQTASRQAF